MKIVNHVEVMLIESLKLLAADPDDQIAALPSVHVPDEIAEIYDDCYLRAIDG